MYVSNLLSSAVAGVDSFWSRNGDPLHSLLWLSPFSSDLCSTSHLGGLRQHRFHLLCFSTPAGRTGTTDLWSYWHGRSPYCASIVLFDRYCAPSSARYCNWHCICCSASSRSVAACLLRCSSATSHLTMLLVTLLLGGLRQHRLYLLSFPRPQGVLALTAMFRQYWYRRES